MWFNSPEYFYFFLPLAFALTLVLRRILPLRTLVILFVLRSLAFYGWSEPPLVALLVGSILLNYVAGLYVADSRRDARHKKRILVAAIAANLLCLGVFKYADFVAINLNDAFGLSLAPPGLPLPLGVSFFLFLEIAYLVDCHRQGKAERRLERYAFFVSYFPHLVAGPILRQNDIMPQVEAGRLGRPSRDDLMAGVVYLALGLFKKTILADSVAPVSDAVFGADPASIGALAAWVGALAFTLQIYFDFSGYSDIAIGTSRLLGIRLPFNFASPYKAATIMEFWRRWHITLSVWLRDYLYIPMGGSRGGRARTAANLMVVMLLAGLWHGAGWTFVIWGGLHGAYLVIGHLLRHTLHWQGATARLIGHGVTLLAVVVAWVFFRAGSLDQAAALVMRLVGAGTVSPFFADLARIEGASPLPLGGPGTIVAILGLFIATLALPNTQQLIGDATQEAAGPIARLRFGPNVVTALLLGGAFALALLAMPATGVFIYFRF